jgi:hypothetical protein
MTMISVTFSTGSIIPSPPFTGCTILGLTGSEIDCGVWGWVVESSDCLTKVLGSLTGCGAVAFGREVSSRSKMNLSSSKPLLAYVFYFDLAPIVPGAINGLPQYGLFN